MKNNKFIYMILMILVLIIILVITLIYFLSRNDKKIEVNNNTSMLKVTDREEFYSIENCIQKQQKDNTKYIAEEMYTTKNEKYSVYSVKGIVADEKSKEIKGDAIYKVTKDIQNNLFVVTPISEKIDNLSDLEISTENIEEIQANNNKYETVTVSDEDIINKYLLYYQVMALSRPDIAYEKLLDEEYREAKFKNVDEYKEYVNERKEEIQNLELYMYEVIDKQYIARWTNFNFYTFIEKGVMDFKVMLDIYTKDNAKIIKNYNNGNNQVRAGLVCEKFIAALNDKDYEYIYNKLDSDLKEDNFPTLQDFEKYIQQNFFEENFIDYDKYSEIEGDSIITGIIQQRGIRNPKQKNITFIIKLLENRDFTIAFEFN